MILVDYLISIQLSNCQEVACLVLAAVWRLNPCPAIIANVPREMVTSGFNPSPAGRVRIEAIDLIPKRTRVVPPPIVHLVTGFINPLPHI